MGDSIVIGEHEFFHNLRQEQAHQRWSTPADTKTVEAHYRARLVRVLERRGIGPVAVRPENDPVDLDIAGYPVELKVARAHAHPAGGKPTRFQALLRDHGNGHHLNGEFVILLCVDREDRLYPFVIPTGLLASQRTLEITSHPERYTGKWAPYLRAWDYFAR
jgi:hypothetical protein